MCKRLAITPHRDIVAIPVRSIPKQRAEVHTASVPFRRLVVTTCPALANNM
jgi:hypothetical protein